ncbi:sodium/proline symporter PutP [Oscillospiraceae bacterium OttesenSCG-928-F05]|nr:sodium/proline symporter PutP [Oscillospiraceae bacterium OttesenSCG-928-F05]
MSATVWTVIAFVLYAGVMLGIGAFFFRKSSNLTDYFLGGRQLNSWVAAMSAQASDMSGWLLMGLPGAVYAFGTGQIWIAVGLAIGTVLNWVLVAKRLRRYTIVAGDAITVPEYFNNRFKDRSGLLRVASAVFITIFFAVYTASAFVAGGTLFSQVFGLDYQLALLLGVLLILIYTFLGGFSAVCWTDLIQGLLMFAAILLVPILALVAVGGTEAVTGGVPGGFLNVFSDGAGGRISGISIVSQLAWGLGYFGMPHILVRFMAIKSERSVKKSSAIAIIWVLITLGFAVVVGVVGAAFVPGLEDPETVFIQMIQKIFMSDGAFVSVPLLGGLFLCGILAAIMSTADSQLLVTASSITEDIYKGSINKKATDKHLVWFSRFAVLAVSVIAYIIATDRTSSIMGLVSNAWSGFGSAFGALVLLSLYWKRTNRPGAAAGIIVGGLTVILWDYIPLAGGATLGAATGLYSLVPGFALSFVAIIAVSLLTKAPSAEIQGEFERVAAGPVEEEKA